MSFNVPTQPLGLPLSFLLLICLSTSESATHTFLLLENPSSLTIPFHQVHYEHWPVIACRLKIFNSRYSSHVILIRILLKMSYDPYVFTHGTGSEVTRYNEGQTSSHQYDTLDPKQVTCRAWLSGACKSRYCYYTHEHRDYVSPPQPYTCWFWSMGRCSESAETCTYTHSLDALTAQRPQRFVRDRKLKVPNFMFTEFIKSRPRYWRQECSDCHRRKRRWLRYA